MSVGMYNGIQWSEIPARGTSAASCTVENPIGGSTDRRCVPVGIPLGGNIRELHGGKARLQVSRRRG